MSKESERINETIEAMSGKIAEIERENKALRNEINELKKNVQYKKKAIWPITDLSCERKFKIDTCDITINSKGMYVTASIDEIKKAVIRIHDKNEEAIKRVNERDRYQSRYGEIYNTLIDKEFVMKDWPTDFSEPDKKNWLDNNNLINWSGLNILNKTERKGYAEYFTVDGHNLSEGLTSISYDSSSEKYRISTTDDRVKSYIMRNEKDFIFIKKVIDRKDKNKIEWHVGTSKVELIAGLLE